MYCPVDFKPCCDDLCYGGGCIRANGEPMYYPCPGCHKLISDDDTDMCRCDPCDEFEDHPHE